MGNRRTVVSRSAVAVALCVVVAVAFFATGVLGQSPPTSGRVASGQPLLPVTKTLPPGLPTATPGNPKFGTPVVDNRSTEERATAYIQGLQDHMARRARWIEEFQRLGRDASKLPRSEKAVGYVPGQPTLAAALSEADLVIEGRVVRVTHTPQGSVGTVQVTAMHKITPTDATRLGTQRPTEVQVELGYSPEPEPGYTQSGGGLAYQTNMPLFFPGDRALLFLRYSPIGSGQFYVQGFTGGYAIDANGRVIPVAGNPFASQVQGLSLDQFTMRITDELRRLPSP